MATNSSATPGLEPARNRPRLALALATALGVGYIPKAPGTFGSLVGIAVAILTHPVSLFVVVSLLLFRSSFSGLGMELPMFNGHPAPVLLLIPSLVALLVVGLIGVWSGSRVSGFAGIHDPQYVVIDEVSGMQLTLVLAIMPLGLPTRLVPGDEASVFALYSAFSLLNWKYLLLGFILFRAFDIWKPWPIRRLEKLPGGWGIMADDWMAGVYAAILLRVALYFGLLTLHIGWV
ncbi:MAG TPA: phosphatidylglycerophosphatase A [Candidatus Acidoferrum sp.]|nr:phosphatidylglycerophosphatase A [Candidatus Acidoferrum sp.]HZC66252.1 phosphatidylglycerophosphatase A [Candidatus Dormibacteraeota bacterium]